MKRIYKCIFELLLGITIVALCIFVFNFSLLGMESYIFHYPQWLLGHCLAVLFVLCIFLLLLITFNYAISHDLRLGIKKATKFISLITLIIFAYIAIIGIDYDLLFHKTKKYPAYPSYVKVKGEYTVGTVPTVYNLPLIIDPDKEDDYLDEKKDTANVYDVVEQMPNFPGGYHMMQDFIEKNLRYPKECAEKGIQGRVIIAVVVERSGKLTNIRVVKSVNSALDKEALRIVNLMPKWIPGRQSYKEVRVKYIIPITFRI